MFKTHLQTAKKKKVQRNFWGQKIPTSIKDSNSNNNATREGHGHSMVWTDIQYALIIKGRWVGSVPKGIQQRVLAEARMPGTIVQGRLKQQRLGSEDSTEEIPPSLFPFCCPHSWRKISQQLTCVMWVSCADLVKNTGYWAADVISRRKKELFVLLLHNLLSVVLCDSV